MASLDELLGEIKKIRDTLLHADADFLAGKMKPDIYDKIASAKLEMMRLLVEQERIARESNKRDDLRSELKGLEQRALDLAHLKSDGSCPFCRKNGDPLCRPTTMVDSKKGYIAYGVYCYRHADHYSPRFESQGHIPLPFHVVEYLRGNESMELE